MAGAREYDRQEREVDISIDENISIKGSLSVVAGSEGIVIFAHGSGSGRFSPRNRYVAQVLQDNGLSTLLIDLLTEGEELIDMKTRQLRFDIDMLSCRLLGATLWIMKDAETKQLKIGYYGASTGAAAALIAAAEMTDAAGAVVSRGGRPDLADQALSRVTASTLLIVGGNDPVVIDINEQAMVQLSGEKKMMIIPGAGHLFEEPGALEQVAKETSEWFVHNLCGHKIHTGGHYEI